MPQFSILIACDQKYYDGWSVDFLKSTHYHAPWLKLRCHVVNPTNIQQLKFVDYTKENIKFANETSEISYLQSARFIAAAKIPMSENFITLDADTICTRPFSENDFSKLFDKSYVKQHNKQKRWLAGLVSFGQTNLRYDYSRLLCEKPINDWEWGRDQIILEELDKTYNFTPVTDSWLAIGKNRYQSAFVTLKGDQKTTAKYLDTFNSHKR